MPLPPYDDRTRDAKGRFLVACFILIVIYIGFSFTFRAFADPPTSPYTPGETLSPTCAPGSTNCTVQPPLFSTTTLPMGGILFISDNSGTVSAATSSLYWNSANPQFQIGATATGTATGTLLLLGSNQLAAPAGHPSGTWFGINQSTSTGSDFLNFETNSTTEMEVSSSGAVTVNSLQDNNFLGLGTSTNPTNSIFYVATATPLFNVQTNGLVSLPDASGGLVIGTSSLPSSSLLTVGSSSDIFSVLGNGNVGIGTTTPSQALSVVGNISNLTANAYSVKFLGSTNVHIAPFAVYVSGHYAYTANNSNNTISVVDVSNPSAPIEIATTTVGAAPYGIYVSGRYAYTANNSDNDISVVDISNPFKPIQVATTSVGVSTGPTSIYVSGRYAYVTNGSASTISVVDVSNPLAPVLVGTTTVGSTPESIYLSGRYAYTANGGGNDISVVDISNPHAPIQVATTSVDTEPQSIYVSGRYAYTANITGNDISVVDISNALKPIDVGTTTVGSEPYSIFISGRYAYVANFVSNSMSIVDVSNPLVPVQIATSTTGTSSGPDGIYVVGRYAYTANDGNSSLGVTDIGGTETTSLTAGDATFGNLQVMNDILNQGNLQVAGGIGVGQGGIFSAGGISSAASSSFAALAIGTSTASQALSVVGNISNLTTNSSYVNQIATTTVGANPDGIYVSGHYAYTANSSGNSISVVDVSNPLVPIQIATTSVGTTPFAIYVSGRYAYTANYGINDISVVDVSNPHSPIQVATTSVGVQPGSIYVSGHYAYIANSGANTISVVDISSPAKPIQIATTTVGSVPGAIYVSGRYAYTINSGDNDLSVVDVSNPAKPIQLATTSVGSAPDALYVSGRYAYAANSGDNDISVVDISNPLAPIQVATTSVAGSPYSIYVSGRYAYVSNGSGNTISVVDVSNPAKPIQVATTIVGTNPYAIYVSGRYAYTANYGVNSISVVDIGGTETTSLTAGGATFGNLQVMNDILAQGNLQVTGGIGVGQGGIFSAGGIASVGSSTFSALTLGSPSSTEGQLFFSNNFTSSTVAIRASTSTTSNMTLTLPSSTGIAGQDLVTDGSGNLSWASDGFTVITSSTASLALTTSMASYISTGITPANTAAEVWITADLTASTTVASATVTMGIFRGTCTTQVGATSTITFDKATSTQSPVVQLTLNAIDNPGVAALQSYSLCAKSLVASTAGAISGQLTLQQIRAGSDVAEVYYAATDTPLLPGNVVDPDPALDPGVQPSQSAYDPAEIGVVSTQPGEVLGTTDPPEGVQEIIALAGRVPVYVTNENGDINVGDYLTASNIPGVAMRSTQPGKTIGIALEGFAPDPSEGTTTSQILMFVNPGWSLGNLVNPADIASSSWALENASSGTQFAVDQFTAYVQSALAKLGVDIHDGIVTLQQLIANQVTTNVLCVQGTCINGAQLQNLLNQNGDGSGNSQGTADISGSASPSAVLIPPPDNSSSSASSTMTSDPTSTDPMSGDSVSFSDSTNSVSSAMGSFSDFASPTDTFSGQSGSSSDDGSSDSSSSGNSNASSTDSRG